MPSEKFGIFFQAGAGRGKWRFSILGTSARMPSVAVLSRLQFKNFTLTNGGCAGFRRKISSAYPLKIKAKPLQTTPFS